MEGKKNFTSENRQKMSLKFLSICHWQLVYSILLTYPEMQQMSESVIYSPCHVTHTLAFNVVILLQPFQLIWPTQNLDVSSLQIHPISTFCSVGRSKEWESQTYVPWSIPYEALLPTQDKVNLLVLSHYVFPQPDYKIPLWPHLP
jgi:hypothetical protein